MRSEKEKAERIILGAIFVDNSAFDDAARVLSPTDFSAQRHKAIFRAMAECRTAGEEIDLVSVKNRLLDILGVTLYLAELVEEVPSLNSIVPFVEAVKGVR